MKKLISRVCCLCCVVLVLAACLPFSAFAVDPVSAGVMANAFAQAIAAYGASNGVAMTFDVSNTSGIGESVHELWKDFREGTQDADDYATLAAALFPDLYYKASSVVGGVSDVYTVGYNISSTYAEEFDNFYNWLLSGPAEMVKVDNSYFQFSDSQIGPSASPISVFSTNGFANQPVTPWSMGSGSHLYSSIYAYSFSLLTSYSGNSYVSHRAMNNKSTSSTNYRPVYVFAADQGSTLNIYGVSAYQNQVITYTYYTSSTDSYSGFNVQLNGTDSTTGLYYSSITGSNWDVRDVSIPVYPSLSDGLNAVSLLLSDSLVDDAIGVKASTNTGVAEFPDTADPNYEAVGKQIPSTVPWDNTAYGDGTGTLTDAQAGAIAAGADTVIARDGVLDLAGTDETTDEPGVDDPPTTDPDDYVVPGLAEIFPFCIPFDIYNFLSALAANPVAPHFTATLDFPEAVGGTQTIDIDFDSPTWNQLAQLLRLLELLAFIVGLALLTRSMFLRG